MKLKSADDCRCGHPKCCSEVFHGKKSVFLAAFLVLLAVLIALRLALPRVVTQYVNRQLHAMKSYEGSVQDVDIHLLRGAYRVHGIRIVKTGGARTVPFFRADHVDFCIE